MLTFYPDKPYAASPDLLERWQQSGKYVCQAKMDGWRVVLMFEKDGVTAVTRHGNDQYSLEIEKDFYEELMELREIVPAGTQLDGEWCKRRCVELGLEPRLYLFDCVRWGGKWLINDPLEARQSRVMALLAGFEGGIRFVDQAPSDGLWKDFYETMKARPETEGVVVKARTSKLVADRRKSAKNRRWYKVKYRDGIDPETFVRR